MFSPIGGLIAMSPYSFFQPTVGPGKKIRHSKWLDRCGPRGQIGLLKNRISGWLRRYLVREPQRGILNVHQ